MTTTWRPYLKRLTICKEGGDYRITQPIKVDADNRRLHKTLSVILL